MCKAPKGRKIEAYYTSLKGYNPFTGEKGRKLNINQFNVTTDEGM